MEALNASWRKVNEYLGGAGVGNWGVCSPWSVGIFQVRMQDSVQRFNASAHLSLQTEVVLRVAEVIFSQL